MVLSLDRVATRIQAMSRCESVERFADESLDLLLELIPCDGIGFNEIDEARRRIHLFRERSDVPVGETEEDFWSYADDLPICWGLAPGAAGVVRTEDVVSRRKLTSTRVYSEVLHPFGAEYQMKLAFASPTSISRGFVFERSDHRFTDRERDVVLLLAPHLSDVYRRIRLLRRITGREREILELVAGGFTNREVARQLDISPGTVRAHLEHVFSKLNVGTRTAAVAAIR
jgi:DNA-binding CsgD family transcriptional regulator